MTAIVGTTSYGFRYLLSDERSAPGLAGIIERTAGAGLEALQICENARPLAAGVGEWRGAIARAADLGLALHLGCMTLDPEVLSRYLERAAMIPGASALRIVLEDDTGRAPDGDRIARFLESAARLAAAARLTLAIENHFHIPCRLLAEACRPYPRDVIGFCLDSANSLRNWESADAVFDALDDRALFYHLKDYRVRGSNVGFEVGGAPLGEGDLELERCLERIFARHSRPLIFLENWVPTTADREADVAADADWLTRSAAALRRRLDTRAVVSGSG